MNMTTTGSESLLRSSCKKYSSILACFLLALTFLNLALAGSGRAATSGPAYTIGPGDVLTVDVYDNPDMKGLYTVSPEGFIVFPLLERVEVAGLDASAVKDRLTQLLEQDYLYNPIVNVTVSEHRSRKVKIMGNVAKPGIYYLDAPTSFFEILTRAGGVKQFGIGLKGYVNRTLEGSQQDTRLSVDLHQLLTEGREEVNLLLQDGDVIYVPEIQDAGAFIHVVGEVRSPGKFPFQEGMTVLKAITLAGGATQKAAQRNTVIKRMQENRVQEIKTTSDTLLEPDDIVDVPLSFW
jgi:polysaccharide export outer membrane protein